MCYTERIPQTDPSLIDKAASNVVSAPLAYMQLAQQYLECACDSDPLAFGIIGLPILRGRYEQTRTLHLDNIKAGCDKLNEMASGLSYVAAFWADAEVANTPTGTKPDIEYVAPSGNSNIINGLEFTGLYFAWTLAALRLAVSEVLKACGKLAPTAMTACAAWLLWTPDDARLSEMQGGWALASSKVDAVNNELTAALKPLDEGWLDCDDRDAFDTWLPNLQTELDQTVSDLKAVGDRLTSLQAELDDTQLKLLTFAAYSLTIIISNSFLQAVPSLAAFATLAKNIQGLMLGFATVGVLGDLIATLTNALLVTPSSIIGRFPSLTLNANGVGTGLKDIAISWDDSAAARYAD